MSWLRKVYAYFRWICFNGHYGTCVFMSVYAISVSYSSLRSGDHASESLIIKGEREVEGIVCQGRKQLSWLRHTVGGPGGCGTNPVTAITFSCAAIYFPTV